MNMKSSNPDKVFEKSVHRALRQMMHPEINHNLVDLGMIKNVIVEGNKVVLTLTLPFMHVPIKEELMRSVRNAIKKLSADAKIEIKLAEMNEKERANFMKMAREAWIG